MSLQGSSFEYYGCYLNVEANISYVNKTFMSSSICIEFCKIGHYCLAALSVKITGALFLTNAYEAYGICSCSNGTRMNKVNESLCNFPCPKSPDEICGGYNQTIFSVHGVAMRGYKNTGNNDRNTIGIVVGATFAVIGVMVIAVVILILYRRYQTRSFTTTSNLKCKSLVLDKNNDIKSRDMKSESKGKLNYYVHTDHSNSNISERELYETVVYQDKSNYEQSINICTNESGMKNNTYGEDDAKYEIVEETGRDRAVRNIYRNKSIEKYMNINADSETVENKLNHKANANGELYYNIDEHKTEEYEIPTRTESVPHLYSTLNADSEEDALKSETQVLENTEEEYEFMMPQ